MSRLKSFFSALLWMAVPVGVGMTLLQLEHRGTGPAMIGGLLAQAEGAIEILTEDPAAPQAHGSIFGDIPPATPVVHTVPAVTPSLPMPQRVAAPVPAPTVCASDDEIGIAIGDTVSVRFFEDVDTTTGAASVTFERRDLATSVQVDKDGTIAVPALGRVQVFAKRPACLEDELTRAASDRLDFVGRTSVSFALRPATLVRGDVQRPGSYAFDPALTPTRLVTLAGHVDAAGTIGAAQHGSLLAQQAELHVARLGTVLSAERLRAVLAGADTLDLSAEIREEIAGTLGAAALEAETDLLQAELRTYRKQQDFAGERAVQAKKRVSRLQDTLAATEAELAHVRQGRDRLSDLLDNGAVTSNRLNDAERSTLSLERERLERSNALEDARAAADAARQDVHMAEIAWRHDRIETLRNMELDLRRLDTQLAGLDARIATAGKTDERPLRYTLERITPDGPVRREIDGDTVLMPGDLVTVSLSGTATTGPIQ